MEINELNDIKKRLYKESPIAKLEFVNKEFIHYGTTLADQEFYTFVDFVIPLSDIGDAKFLPQMKAKHLIRYIVKE